MYSTSTRIRRTIPRKSTQNNKRNVYSRVSPSERSTPEPSDDVPIFRSINNEINAIFGKGSSHSITNHNLISSYEAIPKDYSSDSSSDICTLSNSKCGNSEIDPTKNLTFTEWLEFKLESLKREHNIITDRQYELLVSMIHKDPSKYPIPSIGNDLKEYSWAVDVINRQQLLAVQRVNGSDTVDVIVQEKQPLPYGLTLRPDVDEGTFYNYYREVPRFSAIESILKVNHLNTGHRSYRELHNRVKQKFSYISREMCHEFKKRCEHCNRLTASTNKGRKPLHPINSRDTFHHMQLDLINFVNTPAGPDNRYHYVAHLVDHYSTYHITEAIETKNGYEIVHFLRKAFSVLGFPLRLHTDNGSEFVNKDVKSYLESQKIELVNGKPYTPTTQGKVERANRSIQEIMQKLVSESCGKKTWFDVLYEATLALNTTTSKSINKTPYEHVFCSKPINEGNLAGYQATADKLCTNTIPRKTKELENLDGDGYESPGVAETDPGYDNINLAKRIRQDSHEHITKYRKKMKINYDRWRKVNAFKVGDIVGVVIPNDYKNKVANKLPAIIIEIRKSGWKNAKSIAQVSDEGNGDADKDDNEDNDEELSEDEYILGYGDYRLDHIYYQHDLIPFTGKQDYFGVVVKDMDYDGYLGIITVSHHLGLLKSLPLQTAYKLYTSLLNESSEITESEVEDNLDDLQSFQKSDTKGTGENVDKMVPMQAVIMDKTNNEKKLVTVKLADSKCRVCCRNIESNADYDVCYKCGCKMHTKDECQFPQMRIGFRNRQYCTFACFRNQEVYEVKIVKEHKKAKQYTILCSNGSTTKMSMKKVESYDQYAKMLYDWRQTHPINLNNDNNVDNDEIEIISANIITNANVSDKDASMSCTNACCVCNEELGKDNPHSCFGCKRRMHGHIICPQRHLIYADDEKLYCNACKP
jgi:transposase InsO family protein